MCLEERHFFTGCLGQAQLVGDLLLAPALHYHVALLEMVGEVLHHIHNDSLSALVHEIWFGQDSWEVRRRAMERLLLSSGCLNVARCWHLFCPGPAKSSAALTARA